MELQIKKTDIIRSLQIKTELIRSNVYIRIASHFGNLDISKSLRQLLQLEKN